MNDALKYIFNYAPKQDISINENAAQAIVKEVSDMARR